MYITVTTRCHTIKMCLLPILMNSTTLAHTVYTYTYRHTHSYTPYIHTQKMKISCKQFFPATKIGDLFDIFPNQAPVKQNTNGANVHFLWIYNIHVNIQMMPVFTFIANAFQLEFTSQKWNYSNDPRQKAPESGGAWLVHQTNLTARLL